MHIRIFRVIRMIFLSIFFLTFVVNCDGANIFLLPMSHSSHVNFFSVSGKAIKGAGHEVYVLAHETQRDKIEKHGLKAILHSAPATKEFEELMIQDNKQYFEGTVGLSQIYRLAQFSTKLCRQLNEDDELIKQLKELKFDLVIVDGVFFSRCLYMIPYRLSLPYITLNAFDDPWSAGIPAMPSMQPLQMLTVSNKMNFIQRVQNLLIFIVVQLMPRLFIPNSMIKEFVPDRPEISFAELYSQSKMVLVNLDSTCFDYPRISAPHYQYLAGAGNSAAKPLPKNIEDFVQGAKDGVILVSFGSIPAYSKMPHGILKIFMDAFAEIPQKVIMKYDGEAYPNIPGNVKLLSWLPQNDILGHPKTKLFITHGGNNGQLESLFHAIPMLTLPFTGDQHYNAERVVAHGYGLKSSFPTLTSDRLKNDISEIIYNSSYKTNIERCSEIVKSFPTPHDTIVFWVNHILKFGSDHLRPPSLDMNFLQMFSLDVLLFLGIMFVVATYIVFKLCISCLRICCGSSKKAKTE